MTRSMDEILGITKTKAKHDFEVGQRIKTNDKQRVVAPGREGIIIDFDQYNMLKVRLGILPKRAIFYFHYTYVEHI